VDFSAKAVVVKLLVHPPVQVPVHLVHQAVAVHVVFK